MSRERITKIRIKAYTHKNIFPGQNNSSEKIDLPATKENIYCKLQIINTFILQYIYIRRRQKYF